MAVTHHAISINPPYPLKAAERVPQLFAFRLALSMQKKTLFEKLHAAECGVYKGQSLLAFAKIARESRRKVTFWGLDSFEGFPELSKYDVENAPNGAIYAKEKVFADVSLSEVDSLFKAEKFKNVNLIKGFFKDTLKTLEERKYFFVNIDCDLYEPHKECMDYFYPRMANNGVMFFDDYYSPHFPMAKLAIDEFVKKKKMDLIHLRYGDEKPNHTKVFAIVTNDQK